MSARANAPRLLNAWTAKIPDLRGRCRAAVSAFVGEGTDALIIGVIITQGTGSLVPAWIGLAIAVAGVVSLARTTPGPERGRAEVP